MRENKIEVINRFNEKLIGLENIPDSILNEYPTVILVHGFGVTKEGYGMFDEIAKRLTKADFLIYRFDFSGCGESEGDYSETSLSKLKSDLARILEFVKSQPKVNKQRIGILAQSFGTATTVALEPEVDCLVMMGSITRLKETFVKLFSNGYNPEGISTRVTPSGKIIEVKPQFWEDLDNHNLLELIKKIHCPILFIHGSEDDKIPISNMEEYFENANEPKEKLVIEGADHVLRPHREIMHEAVIDWFRKYLNS